MTATMLNTKINNLPPSMIKEVNNFVEFLKTKERKGQGKKIWLCERTNSNT
jgi:hypothetical protein